MRVGHGYDSHRLVAGRRLVLGGVDIPHRRGLLGHSDGDALLHAITDSILGALGLGDIGKHFPDTDPAYKDASSLKLLAQVVQMASKAGYKVAWVDATVIAEEPKLAPYIGSMREAIASTGIGGVNVKATTNEGMGAIGRGEGIAAHAVCLLNKTGV